MMTKGAVLMHGLFLRDTEHIEDESREAGR